jgi:hypothetical protein
MKVHRWTTISGNFREMSGTSQPLGPQFWSILVNPWDPKLAKIRTRPHGGLSGGLPEVTGSPAVTSPLSVVSHIHRQCSPLARGFVRTLVYAVRRYSPYNNLKTQVVKYCGFASGRSQPVSLFCLRCLACAGVFCTPFPHFRLF